jgi:hypothetical protein
VQSVAVAAARERAEERCDPERGAAAPQQPPSGAAAAVLDASEPNEADCGEQRGDEEVQAKAEDVVGRIDAQQLLEDAESGVARDVEREQPWSANPAPPPEPDEGDGQREIPDELVEEGRLKCRVLRVAGGAVRGVDVEGPGQGGWAAEELLVEVIPYAADGLRHEQPGRGGVQEARDACLAAA